MIFITGIFLFAPLIIKLPFVDDIVSWILLILKQQVYKSSYIEVLGAIAGSWLAITGAIYTQRKSEYEKLMKQEEASLKQVESNKILAKVLCQEMLWNEIKSNNYNMKKYHNDPDLDLLKAIKEERTNYHYDGKQNNYHFSN